MWYSIAIADKNWHQQHNNCSNTMIIVVGDDNDGSEDEEWNENTEIDNIFLERIHCRQIHTCFR